jgi:glycosyltransferase involved in cell wall biosynthesis
LELIAQTMHLYYVANFDSNRSSGEAGHVRGVVRAFDGLGHEVWVFASGWPRDAAGSVHFWKVPQLTVRGLYALSFGALVIPVVLLALLRRKPDVIVSRYFKFVLPLIWIARLWRIPFVLEVNSDLRNERDVAGVSRRRAGLESRMEKKIYASATGIVAVADSIRERIVTLLGSRHPPVTVVENGVDTDVYSPIERDEARAELDLCGDIPIVAYAGGFNKYQGIPDLVSAFAEVLKAFPQAMLLLAGDGPERESVAQQVAQLGIGANVHLYGNLPERRTALVLGAADVCVAPYNALAAATNESDPFAHGARCRGSPLKVFSYLACGRPVVATHFREAGVLVERYGAGCAVPPEDTRALAVAICGLLADAGARRAMGEAGRAAAVANHSWAAAARSVIEFIASSSQRGPT